MVAHVFAAVLEAEGLVSEEQGFLKFLLLVLPKAACACVQDPVKAGRLPATSPPQLFTCLPTSQQLRLCCLHCFDFPTLTCREFSRESCCISNFPFPAELGPGKAVLSAKSNCWLTPFSFRGLMHLIAVVGQRRRTPHFGTESRTEGCAVCLRKGSAMEDIKLSVLFL